MAGTLCKTFINSSPNSYRPLACKPVVVNSRELTKSGLANRQELFFLTKPNTIREHATVDLLYPIPLWLKREVDNPSVVPAYARVTSGHAIRIVDFGLIRVTSPQ